jgi:tryptophan synthase alpha chain
MTFSPPSSVAADPALAAVPLVGMVSFSIIHRRGAETFLDQAQAAGLCGAMCPICRWIISPLASWPYAATGCQLVTPTTPRGAPSSPTARRHLYFVSVTGIWACRDDLPAGLVDQVRWLRGQTLVPRTPTIVA